MFNSSESDESVTSVLSNIAEDTVNRNTRHTIFIPTAYEDRTVTTISKTIRTYLKKKCIPSRKCSVSCLTMICPFLTWMRNYEWAWLPRDIICGMTVRSLIKNYFVDFIFLRFRSCKFHREWLMHFSLTYRPFLVKTFS